MSDPHQDIVEYVANLSHYSSVRRIDRTSTTEYGEGKLVNTLEHISVQTEWFDGRLFHVRDYQLTRDADGRLQATSVVEYVKIQ